MLERRSAAAPTRYQSTVDTSGTWPVEYAVTSQVVTRADLPLLDDEALRNQSDPDGD